MSTQDVTELCKPVDGFPNYRVWRFGIVESVSLGQRRILKLDRSHGGYRIANLYRNGKRCKRKVHRLVLEAFISKQPPGLICCHCDGNKENNRVENLRWDTNLANSMDRCRHGTQVCGEAHPNAKLTESQVRELFALAPDMTDAGLAKKYNIAKITVRNIRYKRYWSHVLLDLPIVRRKPPLPAAPTEPAK